MFLWNTAKPLFFLLSFQCLTHTEKALNDFCPLLKRATVPGAWYIHNNDYCQSCMYHSFSPFWFSLHFYVSSQKPNLRHIDKKAHHLVSITRLIIFAARPFAHVGRVKGKPAAFSSHCSSFLNCVAKVQTYLLPTKQKTKNLCLFNVLQQISMFLPKFIQILSTKTAKCAIYKANMFAFAQYPHTNTRVHYIKTNNKLYL